MARGHIRKRGKNYAVVYYHQGKHHWKTVGPRKKEADAVLAEINAEISKGTYREIRRATFQEFAEEWLKDYARAQVRESTFVGYESLVRNHLVPFFGTYSLTLISTQSVQRFQSEKARGGKLAPATINKAQALLKQMLGHAVLWGYLRENPAQHVKRLRAPRPEMGFLAPQEINPFLEACSEQARPLLTTAIFTGMRRGELLGLQWGDVDWRGSVIRVHRSLYRRKLVEPKSARSRRSIHMSPTLQSVLRRHRLSSPHSDLDLVFCDSAGRPLDPDNMTKREFLPALRRAGLRRIRFHDLRHTFASLMIHQGENVKLIQEALGHASVQVTIDRYGHLLPGVGASAAAKLDETVFGASEGAREASGGT